jgi:hypothetical protein
MDLTFNLSLVSFLLVLEKKTKSLRIHQLVELDWSWEEYEMLLWKFAVSD